MIFVTPFTGILFSIDDAADYHRGDWLLFYNWLNCFYYIEPLLDLLIVILLKRQKEEPYIVQSVFISIVPLFGFIVNIILPQDTIFPFNPFCSVAVALLAFFFMGSQESQRLEKAHQAEVQSALAKAEEASRVKTIFL